MFNPTTAMKTLAWNCRGLGNQCVVHEELVDIVQAQNLIIVFLSETWSSKEHMQWVCYAQMMKCLYFLKCSQLQ